MFSAIPSNANLLLLHLFALTLFSILIYTLSNRVKTPLSNYEAKSSLFFFFFFFYEILSPEEKREMRNSCGYVRSIKESERGQDNCVTRKNNLTFSYEIGISRAQREKNIFREIRVQTWWTIFFFRFSVNRGMGKIRVKKKIKNSFFFHNYMHEDFS